MNHPKDHDCYQDEDEDDRRPTTTTTTGPTSLRLSHPSPNPKPRIASAILDPTWPALLRLRTARHSLPSFVILASVSLSGSTLFPPLGSYFPGGLAYTVDRIPPTTTLTVHPSSHTNSRVAHLPPPPLLLLKRACVCVRASSFCHGSK